MKTTSTNRKEMSVKNMLTGAFMFSMLMAGNFAQAQQANYNTIDGAAFEQNDALEKNPGTGQPVKNITVIAPSIPLCPTIPSLDMIDKSFDKVILGWSQTATFDSIVVRYNLSGTSTYREVGFSGNPNPGMYILQGLTAQTSYDFQIRTKCYTGAVSNWSAPLSLTTFAEPAPRLAGNQRNTISLRVNPNPAQNATTISFVAPINSTNLIIISSSAGRDVYRTTEVCTAGKIQIPVNLTNIAPGLYFVRVYTGGAMSVERLIVQ
jgi:Secretion system C-terminal sorting domain